MDFFKAFFDRLFPQESRVAKVEKCRNLKKERMSVQEFSMKFHQLSRYALEIVSRMRARIRKFV